MWKDIVIATFIFFILFSCTIFVTPNLYPGHARNQKSDFTILQKYFIVRTGLMP